MNLGNFEIQISSFYSTLKEFFTFVYLVREKTVRKMQKNPHRITFTLNPILIDLNLAVQFSSEEHFLIDIYLLFFVWKFTEEMLDLKCENLETQWNLGTVKNIKKRVKCIPKTNFFIKKNALRRFKKFKNILKRCETFQITSKRCILKTAEFWSLSRHLYGFIYAKIRLS